MITADELRKRAALESVVKITDEEAEWLASQLERIAALEWAVFRSTDGPGR